MNAAHGSPFGAGFRIDRACARETRRPFRFDSLANDWEVCVYRVVKTAWRIGCARTRACAEAITYAVGQKNCNSWQHVGN